MYSPLISRVQLNDTAEVSPEYPSTWTFAPISGIFGAAVTGALSPSLSGWMIFRLIRVTVDVVCAAPDAARRGPDTPLSQAADPDPCAVSVCGPRSLTGSLASQLSPLTVP
jgi:hypothetical protein